MTFRQGDLTFELHHGIGETDDATWTWVPELKVLRPGDLFIWALPNAGNPQKVQRYASDWAASLRAMAELDVEIMLCGHGMPIFGADRVRTSLVDTAELLESLEEQTLAMMNQGATLDDVIHTVDVPAHLADKPYLQPVYDHPQYVVRIIWRRYGGWHDGEPDNVLPAPRADQAREWVALAGGISPVLDRVRELLTGDEFERLRLASHLIEFAVLVEPASTDVHALRAEVYRARSKHYDSLMARHLMSHTALSSEHLRRDLAGPPT